MALSRSRTLGNAFAGCGSILFAGTLAHAVCGDVTGDAAITTVDALRVLRAAVGQSVAMTCELDEPPVENYVGYLNLLKCNNANFTSHLTWSEHPNLSWSSSTNMAGDGDPHYKRVDDLIIAGQLDVSFGQCGDLVFDLDSWGVSYPMPRFGGAIFIFTVDPATSNVVLWVADSPVGVAASALATSPTALMMSATPAPKGVE